MEAEILTEGIYFVQGDFKTDGYYTSEHEGGELVWHAYQPPTAWQKMKHYAKYGRPFDNETITTDFYRFFSSTGQVQHGVWMGDAISVAKRLKKGEYSKSFPYTKVGASIKADIENLNPKFKIIDKGQQLIMESTDNIAQVKFKSEVYTFINWVHLH